jgi:hypothetical protein
MSLKAFHIAFITLSSLMCFGCGAWGLSQYVRTNDFGQLLFAIAGLVGGIGLIVYGIRFLRKLKGISFL